MRKLVTVFTFFFLLGISLPSCSQASKKHSKLGMGYAKRALQESLKDKSVHNVVSEDKLLIPDSSTAIQALELVLFSIYGKGSIVKQRPYETYLIDHYWVVSGTLPEDWVGGTFMVIMDARNSQIIRLTHGK